MSLLGQLVKGVLAGGGWTAGKAGAEAVIDSVKEKLKNKKKQPSEEEALENIEVPADQDEEQG